MKTTIYFLIFIITPLTIGYGQTKNQKNSYWKNKLSTEEFRVLRLKGTEVPYTGKYYQFSEKGTYLCKACKTPLFTSTQKFNSGCGWPAFDDAFEQNIIKRADHSYGMERIEVLCKYCHSHLGHLFYDAPGQKNNQRYCINSICLEFKKTP